MKLTRRKFVAAVPVVAGSLLAGGRAFGEIVAEGEAADPLLAMTWNSFVQYVNTDFLFGSKRVPVTLRLIEMTDSRPFSRRRRGQENFVLKFSGPASMPLTQNTYDVKHFGLGRFSLFVTQGAHETDEIYYFAIINRVRS